MSTDPDDPLRWEGDESDAQSGSAAKTPWPLPSAPAAPGKASEPGPVTTGAGEATVSGIGATATPATAAVQASDDDDEPAGVGNVALVFYGIIGGVYLLFAVGWIVGGLRLRPRASLLLADWMYFPWMWLAAFASVLWFAAAWVLTRGRATWIRVVALIAGAVLLVPWPFVMFGTVGS